MARREKRDGYVFKRLERAYRTDVLFDVARDVIKGKYGNGLQRIRLLDEADFDIPVKNIVAIVRGSHD